MCRRKIIEHYIFIENELSIVDHHYPVLGNFFGLFIYFSSLSRGNLPYRTITVIYLIEQCVTRFTTLYTEVKLFETFASSGMTRIVTLIRSMIFCAVRWCSLENPMVCFQIKENLTVGHLASIRGLMRKQATSKPLCSSHKFREILNPTPFFRHKSPRSDGSKSGSSAETKRFFHCLYLIIVFVFC